MDRDIEATFGGKAANLHGFDGEELAPPARRIGLGRKGRPEERVEA